MDFSGKVMYANNLPVKDVRVRVYDKDEPGKIDDDLTIEEGVSKEDGRFTVSYRPSRYLDYTEIQSIAPRNPLIYDFSLVTRTHRVPDPTDVYHPYLEFRYTHSDVPRRHSVSIRPLVREFRLPEASVPDEPFRPSKRGFKFANWFVGYPVPFSVPELPGLQPVSKAYGLCGGMSSAACDYYLYGRDIPSRTTVPSKRTGLHRYLYRRQMDTFGGGRYIVQFYGWMSRPDGTKSGTQRLTYDEFELIRAQLDDGLPVVLGLVYVKTPDSFKMWDNHQVLGYGYKETPSGLIQIQVYDPNCPEDDNVTIEATRVIVGSARSPVLPARQVTVYGLKCTQKFSDGKSQAVRGFFLMPYSPISPPPRLV